jgi:hypothetical protein
VSYEWGLKGGTISFRYPSDKRPDTSRDVLSLGFITPSFDAVLMRIDSHPGATNDYLQLEIVSLLYKLIYIFPCVLAIVDRLSIVNMFTCP